MKKKETKSQIILLNGYQHQIWKKDCQAAKMGTDVSYLIQCVIQTLVETFQIQQDNCSSSLHADFDSIYIATDLNI